MSSYPNGYSDQELKLTSYVFHIHEHLFKLKLFWFTEYISFIILSHLNVSKWDD